MISHSGLSTGFFLHKQYSSFECKNTSDNIQKQYETPQLGGELLPINNFKAHEMIASNKKKHRILHPPSMEVLKKLKVTFVRHNVDNNRLSVTFNNEELGNFKNSPAHSNFKGMNDG